MKNINTIFQKRKFCFRLKDKVQLDAFIDILFKNEMPFESLPNDIFSISLKDKEQFEQLGFQLEEAEIVNLSTLSLKERNAIKEKCRQNWLANKDEAIKKFLKKYGKI
ncbi:MAG: hypothetical protein ABIJ28_01245 [Patescibacteria group bacterium]